jgi:CheY-like chemotaxis protein
MIGADIPCLGYTTFGVRTFLVLGECLAFPAAHNFYRLILCCHWDKRKDEPGIKTIAAECAVTFMNEHKWELKYAFESSLLLLEDNEDLADSLREFLELYSCSTVHVTNGVDGLRKIMVTDFDAILCDMVMPQFPGDMFYRAVQRVKPSLCERFVFMTGHRADPKWDAFIRQIDGLILWKPFQIHELVGALQAVLGKALHLQSDRAASPSASFGPEKRFG